MGEGSQRSRRKENADYRAREAAWMGMNMFKEQTMTPGCSSGRNEAEEQASCKNESMEQNRSKGTYILIYR